MPFTDSKECSSLYNVSNVAHAAQLIFDESTTSRIARTTCYLSDGDMFGISVHLQ